MTNKQSELYKIVNTTQRTCSVSPPTCKCDFPSSFIIEHAQEKTQTSHFTKADQHHTPDVWTHGTRPSEACLHSAHQPSFHAVRLARVYLPLTYSHSEVMGRHFGMCVYILWTKVMKVYFILLYTIVQMMQNIIYKYHSRTVRT